MKTPHKVLLATVLALATIGTAFSEDEMPMKDGQHMGMGEKMKDGHKGMGMKEHSQKSENQTSASNTHNGVMMKDGKMMAMNDGKSTDMTNDMTMSDGTTVTKQGAVEKKDGTKMTMKEGDMVNSEGKVTKSAK